jgi:AcrR family transcriptional regulator
MPSRNSNGKTTTARRLIVAGARRYFLAHGFRSVTMDDIAGELGMSKKTLYAHFKSKVDLVSAVISAKFAELNETLEEITPHAADEFQDTLQRLLTCVQQHAHEIQPAFLRDIRREAPQVFQLVERLRQKAIQVHFGRLFAAGQQRGLVRKDIPPQLLIEVLLGATQSIVNPVKLAELKMTPESGFDLVSGVVLLGALTARGRAKQ